MPNATVRANARPMPETTNRRAVLGALAAGAAASVLTVPTAMAAEPAPESNAELFALISAARGAHARKTAAAEAFAAAERTAYVAPPDTLIATEADARLWGKVKVGQPIPGDIIRHHKSSRASLPDRRHSLERFSPEDARDKELISIMLAQEARMDELIPAFDRHAEERERAWQSSGAADANKRQEDLIEEEHDILDRVAATEAHTMAGMLAKCHLIGETVEPWVLDPVGCDDHSLGVLLSAALDLKRLTASGKLAPT
jgi:uncharacterized membrane protein